jgi:Bacterial DNA-binding protein
MKKTDLARAIAKENRIKTGDAADQVDRAVTRIIRTLRRGNPAHLPGLGTITPGKPWTFEPEAEVTRPARAAGEKTRDRR